MVKKLNDFDINISETISLELTISNKKWFIMFAYKSPIESNKLTFFNEVSNTLNKTVNKYDIILVTGDLNINFSNSKMDTNNYLNDFIDTFSLANIVNSKTCFKTLNGTLLDVMLTNKPKFFCKTCTTETGLGDYHKMILTFLRTSFRRIPSKNIVYRDYKRFNQNELLHELDLEMNKGKFMTVLSLNDDFSNFFKTITDKHAPIK